MEWNINYLKKLNYRNYTSWFFIYDFTKFSEGCGVFVFANSAHHVKYVGFATQNKFIDKIANSIVEGKDQYSNLVMAIYTETLEEAQNLTEYLIEKYKPENNIENTEQVSLDQNPGNYI